MSTVRTVVGCIFVSGLPRGRLAGFISVNDWLAFLPPFVVAFEIAVLLCVSKTFNPGARLPAKPFSEGCLLGLWQVPHAGPLRGWVGLVHVISTIVISSSFECAFSEMTVP